MKNLDTVNTDKQAILQRISDAAAQNDTDAFAGAFGDLCDNIQEAVLTQAREQTEGVLQSVDANVMATRGIRQLTSAEKNYYDKVIEAMRSDNPKQAITDIDVVMPETVINSVFDLLATEHPLLSKINVASGTGLTRFIVSTDEAQKALWGKLCDEIVQEIFGGFKEVEAGQFKLSAFLPICKAMLDLGPAWLDKYIRDLLYEALANGLEDGILNGTGKNMPIGMTKQVGDAVTVTGGEYPDKDVVAITDLSTSTVGAILGNLSVNSRGKRRTVSDVIMVVNPADYYTLVMPATTVVTPNGTTVTNFIPGINLEIVQSAQMAQGKAVIGMAKNYFLAAGLPKNGKIEYDDSYRFLEDERVYLIKLYANGFAKDDKDFMVLDISGLKPYTWKVEQA